MSPFDATRRHREPTNPRDNEETPVALAGLVDDPSQARSHTSLAKGIVWADVVAAIAADEEARQLRDAA